MGKDRSDYIYPSRSDKRRSLSRAEVRKREVRDGRRIRDKHPSKWTSDDLRRLRTMERAARSRVDFKIAARAFDLAAQVKAELDKRRPSERSRRPRLRLRSEPRGGKDHV